MLGNKACLDPFAMAKAGMVLPAGGVIAARGVRAGGRAQEGAPGACSGRAADRAAQRRAQPGSDRRPAGARNGCPTSENGNRSLPAESPQCW